MTTSAAFRRADAFRDIAGGIGPLGDLRFGTVLAGLKHNVWFPFESILIRLALCARNPH
jgi:hypothetical protein